MKKINWNLETDKKPIIYEVQPGDSLSLIAKEIHTSRQLSQLSPLGYIIQALAEEHGIRDKNKILVGQKLTFGEMKKIGQHKKHILYANLEMDVNALIHFMLKDIYKKLSGINENYELFFNEFQRLYRPRMSFMNIVLSKYPKSNTSKVAQYKGKLYNIERLEFTGYKMRQLMDHVVETVQQIENTKDFSQKYKLQSLLRPLVVGFDNNPLHKEVMREFLRDFAEVSMRIHSHIHHKLPRNFQVVPLKKAVKIEHFQDKIKSKKDIHLEIIGMKKNFNIMFHKKVKRQTIFMEKRSKHLLSKAFFVDKEEKK